MIEDDIVYGVARCCQAWVVAIGWPMRPCGYCGEVPILTSENPDRLPDHE